jgi:hypothetical protein
MALQMQKSIKFNFTEDNMNYKKILAVITGFAVAFSMAAAMTAGAAAPAFKYPVWERKTGGWLVNDFRRNGDLGFENLVSINNFDTEEKDLSKGDLNLLLPPDKTYNDIARVKAYFNFGKLDEDGLFKLPNMTIVMQTSSNSWEAHNIHKDPKAKLPCDDKTGLCKNKCKYDSNLVVDIPISAANTEYLSFVVTCDWAGETVTPGLAKLDLYDKKGNPIPLYVFDKVVCKGPCSCPCPKCGEVGIGTCKCKCAICGKADCVCGGSKATPLKPVTVPPKSTQEPGSEKEYSVLEVFAQWGGSGSVTARIDADNAKFVKLLLGENEIDPANYTVSEGSTVITLNEAYIKTLPNGTHEFVAEFEDGYFAKLPLTVQVGGGAVGSGAVTNPDGSPPTGVALAVIPVFLAAGAVAVSKRKK